MNFNEKIKQRRIELDKTLEEIGNICGVSKATVLRWESGEIQNLKRDKIAKLAAALEISITSVLESEIPAMIDSSIRIPLYQPVSCGYGCFVEENIQEMITIPSSMLNLQRQYFANYATGDSMINENIKHGDLLIFEKCEQLNNGQIGCFTLSENEAVCKIFQRDERSGNVLLISANNYYSPITITDEDHAFRVIGKLALVLNNRQNG